MDIFSFKEDAEIEKGRELRIIVSKTIDQEVCLLLIMASDTQAD